MNMQATKKKKKAAKSAVDDLLGDLLDDNDAPSKARPATRDPSRNGGALRSQGGKRPLDDDFFSKLAREAAKDEETSDVSEANPVALLESMKDLDDMDAELFISKKKPSSAPAQSSRARSGQHKTESSKSGDVKVKGSGDLVPEEKPSSAPAATGREYKKFNFLDLDDSLDDLLEDSQKDNTEAKNIALGQKGLSPSVSKKEEVITPKKREELTFDDDEDELMDAMGFWDAPKTKAPTIESEAPQRVRTRLDEILERGTSPRLLERPLTGEKKEHAQQKGATSKDPLAGEDFLFGSYQPTLNSTPEGRQSRRPSVRFSTEDVSIHTPEHKAKPSASATPISARAHRTAADWLGLKQDEQEDEMQVKKECIVPLESPKVPPSSKPAEESSSPKTSRPGGRGAHRSPVVEEEEEKKQGQEDDWLAGALSRKKAKEAKKSQEEDFLGFRDEVDLDTLIGSRKSAPLAVKKVDDMPELTKELGSPGSQELPSSDSNSTPQSKLVLYSVPQQKSTENAAPATLPQVSLSTEGLQQLLLQQQQLSSSWGMGGVVHMGALQRQRQDPEKQAAELTSLQSRIIHLEGQIRSLQRELDENKMLLESVQLRHKQDTELMENTHRARVKLLEESSAQREARMRQENEDLAERLATVVRLAEQERSELQAQQQRRLAQCQQDRDREVERLKELQRKSVLEMKKDHEEQTTRLKRLKDEEIDAVTSATSQTRSLTVVIEQMEQFSRRLGDLSSRVESTHEQTAQGLELGARQRDEQLRVMQDRLNQQQRAMADERTRLQEVIAKMDAQLAEQQRQLEKERWRVTAEQAKAESALKGLEEERRAMGHQISMEREELERAKSALLEEQQSVMQRCAEERRKLAAEWSQLHAQEKLRQERAEREASRALERDAHREGSIISMAQEQAELKLRAGELKQHEEAVARERDALDRLREEMEREKEKVSGMALRLKTRAQEVEGFSKLAAEKYEEGERALQDARQVEAEHQTRLHSIHTQMEQLRQQEQHLHQERTRMNFHRREVERLRQNFPINPSPVTVAPILTDLAPVVDSGQVSSFSAHPDHLARPLSPVLQAKLALLRHTAEKDRDYLEEESVFLESLRTAPYNSM
ncbi:fas-binding factor 1 homolog isoform X4 [Denticeps clupeoides]|uniref:fas-binding factor 1 homolog isoform X4 n=1 Tax=Denticeps clupeoides TaxID=299321 RepID=UPI0010A492EC|nr:fas-binding factor 1 isoform X4 [Denticeps clupeoides]